MSHLPLGNDINNSFLHRTKQDAEQKANLELEYLRGLPVSPYSLLFNRVDDFSVTSLISSACQELGDLEADQVQGGILG